MIGSPGTLDETGLAPRGLTLDITEGALHDDSSVVRVLHGLRALGVRLLLDDVVLPAARQAAAVRQRALEDAD
ncbi:MAG: hypothetical protein QOJ89_523 [bacterium]|jgi:predicted signal transduction protein with EAL and GGDEF domain